MNDPIYHMTYFVLNAAMPEVRSAPVGEAQAVIEKLVEQGKAVKQPSLGSGKSNIGVHLYMQFLLRYEQDNNYTKFEIKVG